MTYLLARQSLSFRNYWSMQNEKPFKIFLVQDDPFQQGIYQQYLLSHGYTDVTLFNNGDDCIKNLDQRPDIIFLDYGIDTPGDHLLKQIKFINSHIYVVFITSQKDMEATTRSLRFGAFDYIIKGNDEQANMERILDNIGQIKELMKAGRPAAIKKFFLMV